MTTRSTAGNSDSRCQTICSSLPVLRASAAQTSRSRFEPGNTTTAAFIGGPRSGAGEFSHTLRPAPDQAAAYVVALLALRPVLRDPREADLAELEALGEDALGDADLRAAVPEERLPAALRVPAAAPPALFAVDLLP